MSQRGSRASERIKVGNVFEQLRSRTIFLPSTTELDDQNVEYGIETIPKKIVGFKQQEDDPDEIWNSLMLNSMALVGGTKTASRGVKLCVCLAIGYIPKGGRSALQITEEESLFEGIDTYYKTSEQIREELKSIAQSVNFWESVSEREGVDRSVRNLEFDRTIMDEDTVTDMNERDNQTRMLEEKEIDKMWLNYLSNIKECWNVESISSEEVEKTLLFLFLSLVQGMFRDSKRVRSFLENKFKPTAVSMFQCTSIQVPTLKNSTIESMAGAVAKESVNCQHLIVAGVALKIFEPSLQRIWQMGFMMRGASNGLTVLKTLIVAVKGLNTTLEDYLTDLQTPKLAESVAAITKWLVDYGLGTDILSRFAPYARLLNQSTFRELRQKANPLLMEINKKVIEKVFPDQQISDLIGTTLDEERERLAAKLADMLFYKYMGVKPSDDDGDMFARAIREVREVREGKNRNKMDGYIQPRSEETYPMRQFQLDFENKFKPRVFLPTSNEDN